jgi:galactose mutarotase-like enzyme
VLRAGDCEVVVLPSVGMLVASFTHRGAELVALPGGLSAYRAGHTTGIPLLYPWANRLSRDRYRAGDVTVDLRNLVLHTDDNGLPIHGTMLARPEWEVTRLGAGLRSARLAARFEWSEHEDLMAAFPFAHELSVDVTLTAAGVRIVTTVRPSGPQSVPVAFGWHPYLQLPGSPRDAWELSLPASAHAALDGRGIPTGRARPVEASTEPLAGRDLDDLFALGPDRVLTLANDGRAPENVEGRRSAPGDGSSGGRAPENVEGRRLTITYDDGYPYAQVFSPAGASFCAVEPMTAPTNALVSGDHPSVRPGETYSAAFTVAVSVPPRRRQDRV